MNPNFYWLMVTRFLFVLGVQIQAVLMGWQMYDLTRDPLQLGLIGLAEAIPALSLSLFAGLLVDRLNPFRFYQLMIVISLVSVSIAWAGHSPSALYLAAALTGLARSFAGPSLNSFIPKLVPREELRRTSAVTTTVYRSAAVIGPGLAGVLLGIRGYDFPYELALGSLVIASLSLFMIRYTHVKKPRLQLDIKPAVLDELLVGARYVFRHPILLSALSLDMFAVLFGGITAILPIYALEILHVGPEGLGWLRAAPAFGTICMSLYLIKKPMSKNAGQALLWSVFGFGICILVFGFSRNFWLSISVLMISGLLDSISMYVRGAIVQLCSPEDMRGRIAAVNSIFIGSSNEIGEFETGVAAKLLGSVPSVIFGGCMTLITVSVVFWKAKSLRTLDLGKL
jgi:MFS family permease